MSLLAFLLIQPQAVHPHITAPPPCRISNLRRKQKEESIQIKF